MNGLIGGAEVPRLDNSEATQVANGQRLLDDPDIRKVMEAPRKDLALQCLEAEERKYLSLAAEVRSLINDWPNLSQQSRDCLYQLVQRSRR